MAVLLFTLPREKGDQFTEFIIETMEQYGFQAWQVRDVSETESVKIQKYLAPKLWNAHHSAGSDLGVKSLIVAYDLAVSPPTFTQKNLYQDIDNARILLFSYHLQNAVSQHTLWTGLNTELCSTPNDTVSRACLSQLWPTLLPVLDDDLKKCMDDVRSEYKVIKDLTRTGCYSRVYLIEYNGALAVEKIYRPECTDKFEREKVAYQQLAGKVDGIPKALAIGKRSFVLPFIEEKQHFDPGSWKLLPTEAIFSITAILRQIYEAGYAIVDCHSGNCLFGQDGKIWLIDFEFLHQYRSKPDAFLESYDIAGIPADFNDAIPPGNPGYLQHPWLNDFGVKPELALSGNKRVVHLHRSFFWASKVLPRFVYRKLRSAFRFLLSILNLLLKRFVPTLGDRIYIRMRP